MKFERRKYYDMHAYVNEDNKTCAVKYKFTCLPVAKEINDKCSKTTKSLAHTLCLLDEFGINNITSTSVCDTDDEFNENAGIDVADLKCSYKFHDKMCDKYRMLLDRLNKAKIEIEELENYHYNKRNNIMADYNRYYMDGTGSKLYSVIPNPNLHVEIH